MTAIKAISIGISITICFVVSFFLNKYDTWGLSEGICVYNAGSAVTALLLATVLFTINFLSLFLNNTNRLVHGVFICIAIGLFIYWYSSIYIDLIIFLNEYVGIQIEQLGQVVVCEWQRYADLRTLGTTD
ncbi:hypothetical protein [Moraxella pluranimalium]|uniref:Uncharacterized protein n=1 Tax=Moraxella pluranimalium TaxID=470453 RepID=A0A1T0CTE6_9GAMM|nr:hypothetical protein [Moraxella pluranimalium]OOS25489.1 hypothetical protein B0680_01250 [Moraxella pluranimalium]